MGGLSSKMAGGYRAATAVFMCRLAVCAVLLSICAVLLPKARAAESDAEALRTELHGLASECVLEDDFGSGPHVLKMRALLLEKARILLNALGPDADPEELKRQLIAAFDLPHQRHGADMGCNDNDLYYHDDEGGIDLFVKRTSGVMVVSVAVGIMCGSDTGSVLFQWDGEQWQSILLVNEGAYMPLWRDFDVARSGIKVDSGVLVLERVAESWCTSSWHDGRAILLRVGVNQEHPKYLFNRKVMVGEDGFFLGKLSSFHMQIEPEEFSLSLGRGDDLTIAAIWRSQRV